MKFSQYRDPAHRSACGSKTSPPAEQRGGQVLSEAPGGIWIMPGQRRPTDPPVAMLGHRSTADPAGCYVLESENNVAQAAQ